MTEFTSQDIEQIESHGLSTEQVNLQIDRFKAGFPFMQIVRSASAGDGILRLGETDISHYVQLYEEQTLKIRVLKFVPASGAASRMFKALFSFMTEQKGNPNQAESIMDNAEVRKFFSQLKKFAFYDSLHAVMVASGLNLEALLQDEHYAEILEYLLTDKGLAYGDLPKGLLEFHRYEDHTRTPLEEHLVEAARYAVDGNAVARVHFTVSPQHMELFKRRMESVREAYESRLGVHFDVSYSTQKLSTDTVAVTLDNKPFRERDGTLLFRPAGHGALLENLNEIDSEVIFIKNIDNVVPDDRLEAMVRVKKMLGGVLLHHRRQIQSFLDALHDPKVSDYSAIRQYIREGLNTELDENADSRILIGKLNRPLRVCGMVVNTGEPGGGPFWCKNADGSVSLQIVESAQINLDNEKDRKIFEGSTHFNPVDIVISPIREDGTAFNLKDYRDMEAGFISSKSKDGRELKAMELPGLWNGSMSDWNTLFVEVPESTFTPVKTVNDLLREEHQQ